MLYVPMAMEIKPSCEACVLAPAKVVFGSRLKLKTVESRTDRKAARLARQS